MFLDNGFEVEGEINNSIVNLNNEWVKVLVFETNIPKDEVIELFKDSKSIRSVSVGSGIEIVYNYKSLIDVKVENGNTFVWLKFVNAYAVNTKDVDTMQELADKDIQIIEVQQQVTDLDLRVLQLEVGGSI